MLGESYQLKAFSYEKLEQLNIGPFIYYASDRDRAVPDVDIVTFVLNENKEPKKIYIQVKRDKNRSRCSILNFNHIPKIPPSYHFQYYQNIL